MTPAGRSAAASGSRACLLLAMPALFLLHGRPALAEVTAEDVDAAIRKGREALLASFRPANHQMGLGGVCLTTMALLNAGVPMDNPKIVEAFRAIVAGAPGLQQDDYYEIYAAGLVNMVLATTGDQKYAGIAKQMVRRIEGSKSFAQARYWGDYSRTQFALLGLKAAEDLGVAVPAKLYEEARKGLIAGQLRDGGWGYNAQFAVMGGRFPRTLSYGSMTAAGVASLYICGARLYTSTRTCGVGIEDEHLAAGMKWLEKNFAVDKNPNRGGNLYYYLYALERVGVLTASQTIGDHDWYKEGAEYLVRQQNEDGTWSEQAGWGGGTDTEFALLFLGKGRAPICVQKLRLGKDWNPDPYDIRNLVDEMSRELKSPMSWQTVDSSAAVEQLALAPVLYVQGHDEFEFPPALRARIRAFVDNGGFLYASACCGSEAFDRSFRAEVRRMFPDSDLARLGPDHPVYSAVKPVPQDEGRVLLGVEVGCRTGVICSPKDLCCTWGACKGCADRSAPQAEISWALGKNMLAYALSYQKLRDKLDKVRVISTSGKPERKRGVLWIGQVYHAGDWNPDPAALPNVAEALRKSLSLDVEIRKARVVPGQDDLYEYPMLYMTGHREFSFEKDQMKALREYLDRGGYLIAEACCGRPAFDAAFRQFAKDLYPDIPLARLPGKHAVFESPYRIENAEYKPAVQKALPDVRYQPVLEGVQNKGRLALAYSRFNLSCELQPHPCATCLGLQRESAYRMYVNLLMYGFRE